MNTVEPAAVSTLKAPVLDPSALRSRHDALKRPYDLADPEMLERQRRQESNARSYPRRIRDPRRRVSRRAPRPGRRRAP